MLGSDEFHVEQRQKVVGSCGAVLPQTHMSVVVEGYFMVEAFASSVSQDSWESPPSQVVISMGRNLDLFDKYNIKGTFNRLFAEGNADYCGSVLTPREALYS